MENQQTGPPYSGKYSHEGSEFVNHTPLTRSARCVVQTNNRPTDMNALDYHPTRGEEMGTTVLPDVRTNRCSST